LPVFQSLNQTSAAEREYRVAVAIQNAETRTAASESRGREVWLTWNAACTVLLPRP